MSQIDPKEKDYKHTIFNNLFRNSPEETHHTEEPSLPGSSSALSTTGKKIPNKVYRLPEMDFF